MKDMKLGRQYMSNMIRVYDGTPVKYSEKQFRLDILPARAPSGYLPDEFLAQYEVYRVKHLPAPSCGNTKKVEENDLPELIDGIWTKTWSIVSKTREEVIQLINSERDKRLNSGFTWNNKSFQNDEQSISNIQFSYLSALNYLQSGGDPNATNWEYDDVPFTWITKTNELITLTATDMISLGETAREYRKQVIFTARQLKDSDTIPEDFYQDKYWPANKIEEIE